MQCPFDDTTPKTKDEYQYGADLIGEDRLTTPATAGPKAPYRIRGVKTGRKGSRK